MSNTESKYILKEHLVAKLNNELRDLICEYLVACGISRGMYDAGRIRTVVSKITDKYLKIVN